MWFKDRAGGAKATMHTLTAGGTTGGRMGESDGQVPGIRVGGNSIEKKVM